MSNKQLPTSRIKNAVTQKKNGNKSSNSFDNQIAASHEYRQFYNFVDKGDYSRALQSLHNAGTTRYVQHCRAVCLMRLGRFSEAVEILRKLVLNHDCVWMRKDIPLVYKTNFATALLLDGHPGGCQSLLAELDDETNSAVIRMRAIMKTWEQSLTAWQRLNWRWFGIEPAKRLVRYDGVCGDFETVLVERVQTESPDKTSPSIDIAT